MSPQAARSDDEPDERRVRSLSPQRLAKYRDEERVIRRAAYRVIGASGPDGASVQDILSEAGLSTRAFYRHYRSKDELILAMLRTEQERMSAELSDVTTNAGGTREALVAWIDQLLAVAYDPKRAARSRVLSSLEAQLARGFAQAKREGMLAMRAVLVEVLRAGRRDGTFPDTDPVEDARAIDAVVTGLVEAKLHGDDGPSWSVAREHTLRIFLPALGVRG